MIPRGIRNNNPGNIRISKTLYLGEIYPSKDKSFKQFKSIDFGYRAIFVLLYTYQKKYKLNTIKGFIERYAPATENATEKYIKTVAEHSGIASNVFVTTTFEELMIPIVCAISLVENGVEAHVSEVQQGWKLFKEYLKNQK